jgi:DNA processing protein
MSFQTLAIEQLLGPLNEVEQKHAPKTLFVTGDRSILEQGGRVSIVGARKASAEGLRRASKLASLFARQGIVVVSGLAEGVDTAAHEASIRNGGRTIAVLGTPLDQVYPKKNAALQAEIMRDHLVVSQYPIGYPVQPKNFPQRNRTMALISDATVIIEATDTSGSLHQGWEALRLGRPVFIPKAIAEGTGLKWPEQMLHFGASILSDENCYECLELLPARVATHFDCGIPF